MKTPNQNESNKIKFAQKHGNKIGNNQKKSEVIEKHQKHGNKIKNNQKKTTAKTPINGVLSVWSQKRGRFMPALVAVFRASDK